MILKSSNGFTITEISIALLVAGVVIYLGFTGAKALQKLSYTKEVQAVMSEAERSIITFIKKHKHLPTEKDFKEIVLQPKKNSDEIVYKLNPNLIKDKITTLPHYCLYEMDYTKESNLTSLDLENDKKNKQVYAFYLTYVSKSSGVEEIIYKSVFDWNRMLELLDCQVKSDIKVVTEKLPDFFPSRSYYASVLFSGTYYDYEDNFYSRFKVCIEVDGSEASNVINVLNKSSSLKIFKLKCTKDGDYVKMQSSALDFSSGIENTSSWGNKVIFNVKVKSYYGDAVSKKFTIIRM